LICIFYIFTEFLTPTEIESIEHLPILAYKKFVTYLNFKELANWN